MVPAPDVTTGVTTTVNALVGGVSTFFTGAWPVLVAMILVILFALIVLRFGMTGIRRLIRFGRA